MRDDADKFDRRDMEMVHTMFRREFGLMPALIRGVSEPARSALIADHFEAVAAVLHHHHHSEEEDLWPLLVQRVGARASGPVELMETQHTRLAEALDTVRGTMRSWCAAPVSETNDTLAFELEQFAALLNEHLEAEEQRLIPLMEQHITDTEFQEMVQKGTAGADPESLPLSFGMLMYEGDEAVVERALSSVPEAARPAIRGLARQAFADYAQAVHGTATPPRSWEIDRP
jgi:iron-sulfur cluster repair protein YtfE (RIC family)